MTESSNSGGSNWRTESFRDNIVAKLNGHIVALDVPLRTDARQMEANIYQKARSEHEYLAYIARLIVYIRGDFLCVLVDDDMCVYVPIIHRQKQVRHSQTGRRAVDGRGTARRIRRR